MNMVDVLKEQSKARNHKVSTLYVRGAQGKLLELGEINPTVELCLAPLDIYCGVQCFHLLFFEIDKLVGKPRIRINGLDYGFDYKIEGSILFAPASGAKIIKEYHEKGFIGKAIYNLKYFFGLGG